MDVNLKAYVVNFKKKEDCKLHISNEFKICTNFDVNIIEAVENNIPAIGLELQQ